MFEILTERAADAVEKRAERQAGEIAERLAEALPAGLAVERVEGGVAVSGRGLNGRYASDASLRAALASAR